MELEPTELAEAIKAVRGGLAAAQQDGGGSPIRFTVKEIVLDLGMGLRHCPAPSAEAGAARGGFTRFGDRRGKPPGPGWEPPTIGS